MGQRPPTHPWDAPTHHGTHTRGSPGAHQPSLSVTTALSPSQMWGHTVLTPAVPRVPTHTCTHRQTPSLHLPHPRTPAHLGPCGIPGDSVFRLRDPSLPFLRVRRPPPSVALMWAVNDTMLNSHTNRLHAPYHASQAVIPRRGELPGVPYSPAARSEESSPPEDKRLRRCLVLFLCFSCQRHSLVGGSFSLRKTNPLDAPPSFPPGVHLGPSVAGNQMTAGDKVWAPLLWDVRLRSGSQGHAVSAARFLRLRRRGFLTRWTTHCPPGERPTCFHCFLRIKRMLGPASASLLPLSLLWF